MNTQEIDLDSIIDVVILSKYNGKPAVTFNPKHIDHQQPLWVNQDRIKYGLADRYLLDDTDSRYQIVCLVRSIIVICKTDADALQIFLTYKK